METTRRELVSQTAAEIWEYLYDSYCVDVDIPDLQAIIDSNIGWTIDVGCEMEAEYDEANG